MAYTGVLIDVSMSTGEYGVYTIYSEDTFTAKTTAAGTTSVAYPAMHESHHSYQAPSHFHMPALFK